MLRKDHIRGRIEELRAMTLRKADVTLERLLSGLEQDRQLAKELGQIGVAVKALELQAKITGQLVERRETGPAGTFEGLESREAVLSRVRNEYGDDAVRQVEAIAEALRRGEQPQPLMIDVTPAKAGAPG
jgi:hypothetical protein